MKRLGLIMLLLAVTSYGLAVLVVFLQPEASAGAVLALKWMGYSWLLGLMGIGLILIRLVRERLANKEDDYYSRNVER
tara:strand:+ start:2023 stop:2256 length:234 start_codon:yes stop_codon:yes gene_type:complete